jgi:hypothetical protein
VILSLCKLAAVPSLGFTALRSGNALEPTAKAISLVSVVNGCFAKLHMEKMELFFVHFGNLPLWYQTIFVGVIASVYGLKATHLIKGK